MIDPSPPVPRAALRRELANLTAPTSAHARANGWSRLWPQYLWIRFAQWARCRIREPIRFVDLGEANGLGDHVSRLVRDRKVPYLEFGPDCDDGRLIPQAMTLSATGETSVEFGAWHIRPGEPDEVLLLRSPGPYYADPLAVAAAHEVGDVRRWLARAKRHWVRVKRRERRPIVVNGPPLDAREPVRWEDVILPPDLLADVRRNIHGFFADRAAYRRCGIPYQRGFLLAGPPGNGKTLLARAIARDVRAPFLLLLGDADTGDGHVRQAFDRARDLAPCILCIEDLDAVLDGDVSLGFFLNELDGFQDRTGVLVLATTNNPEKIDPALIQRPGRFDRVWWIANPEPPERSRYAARLLGLDPAAPQVQRLVLATEGFSMAMIREVYASACLVALEAGGAAPSEADLLGAVEVIRRHQRAVHDDFATGRIGFVTPP